MNVLVLTDLSEVARNAGSYAVQFLESIPVHFHLLNIKLFHPNEPAGATEYTRKLALGKLNQRVEELKEISKNPGHKFSIIYSEDNLVGATRKYVEEKKIDLIVMGAANKGHSPNTIIGNHTYEVITKIKCNILAVSENSRYKTPENLIFPFDAGISVNRQNVSFLDQPGIADGASLTVVEVTNGALPAPEVEVNHQVFDATNRPLEIKRLDKFEAFSEKKLMILQRNFDMIVLLGKNINICNELLHTGQGLYSKVVNELPILVLHK